MNKKIDPLDLYTKVQESLLDTDQTLYDTRRVVEGLLLVAKEEERALVATILVYARWNLDRKDAEFLVANPGVCAGCFGRKRGHWGCPISNLGDYEHRCPIKICEEWAKEEQPEDDDQLDGLQAEVDEFGFSKRTFSLYEDIIREAAVLKIDVSMLPPPRD